MQTTLFLGEHEIIIREAICQDAEKLLKAAKKHFGETKNFPKKPDEFTLSIEEEEKWIKSHQNGKGLLLVAICENEIIGIMNFLRHTPSRIQHGGEMGIGIQKKFWHKGLGRKMIEMLIDWAQKNEAVQRLELKVFAGNKVAIQLYHKLGFIEEGRMKKAIKYENGTFDDMILMNKFISE